MIKQKLTQVKQWLKNLVCKDNQFDFWKLVKLVGAIRCCIWITKIICKLCVFAIHFLVELAPYAEAIFKFIETLASTLSYKMRKGFFMELKNTKLYGISNKRYLSELLNLEVSKLRKVDEFFIVEPFTKVVNRKKRVLYNPSDEHKFVLKRIVNMLETIEFPEYLCGGIPERSYISNAGRHLGNKNLLLLDITNFFPSTRDSYVYDFFRNELKQSVDIAKIMVNLTTVKSADGNYRFLPQGYSTSPIMSFLSYRRMYDELNYFSRKNNLSFSAYYDDFSFSSNDFILKRLKRDATQIIEKYDLKVNSKKSKILRLNHSKITGVIVHDDIMKAPRGIFHKMFDCYLTLRNIDDTPYKYTQDQIIDVCNKFQGCIAAIQSIERERNLEHYKNMLRYIRKKYDVPVEKTKKENRFRNFDIQN